MFSFAIEDLYRRCKSIGLIINARDFSEQILGQGTDYYKYYLRSGADAIPPWVSDHTVATLRAYRDAAGGLIAADMDTLIADAEASARAARQYYRK